MRELKNLYFLKINESIWERLFEILKISCFPIIGRNKEISKLMKGLSRHYQERGEDYYGLVISAYRSKRNKSEWRVGVVILVKRKRDDS